MACITIKKGDYIFSASAGTVTLKNIEIEQIYIRGIYNLNAANNEAIYTGIGDKGGSVAFSLGHTVLTLEFDTVAAGMNDTDELRIDVALSYFEFIFANTPAAGTIPFGTLPAVHPTKNTEPNTSDTGWVYIDDYFKGGQLLYSLIKTAGATGKAYLMNASDATGSQIFGDTNAIPLTALIPLLAGFDFPNKYFRLLLVNDGSVDWDDYVVKSTALQAPPVGLYQSIGSPIPLGTPASVGQQFILGRDDVNKAVSAVVDVHVGSATSSQAVHVGNRVSEVAGHTPFEVIAEGVTSSQELSGTWGNNPLTGLPFKFYCTSYHLAASNSSVLFDAKVSVREVSAAGALRVPFRIEESITGSGGVDKVASGSWSDSDNPLVFDTAVYLLISTGSVEMDLTLFGYLD